MEGKLKNVLLALVDPPVQALRDRIDPDKIRELAESIREQGLIQPVTLRPVNGRFEIVAGHRRYLAHKFLGLPEIKAIVKTMTDMEMTVIRAIENLQREDLTPIEEAKAYKLMDIEGGMTHLEIAKRVGKSKSSVEQYLSLLNLSTKIQDAVDRRQISMRVGMLLGQVDLEDMQNYYLTMAVENGISEHVARVWVDDYFKSKEGTLYDNTGSDPLSTNVVEPTKQYASCNVCQDPVDIREAIHLIICKGCRDRLRSQRGVKS